MNINSVLNTTRPISLYEKEKDTKGASFMEALAQRVKETYGQQSSDDDISVQYVTETISESGSDYTLTDEQLDYLASKYDVDNIDSDSWEAQELLNELVDMGILTRQDALTPFVRFVTVSQSEYEKYFNRFITEDERENSIFAFVDELKKRLSDSGSLIDRLMSAIAFQEEIAEYYRSKDDTGVLGSIDRHISHIKDIMSVFQSISERREQSSGGDINEY